jgi:hypothetical protein
LQEAADAKFISAIGEQYHGDRNKASTELAARGWQYSAERNLADAMRRFNEAWLLKIATALQSGVWQQSRPARENSMTPGSSCRI